MVEGKMAIQNSTYTLDTIKEVAESLVKQVDSCPIMVFKGQMGAGKTTLIQNICAVLEVQDQVSSPTFSIVNEYWRENNSPLYHFDFYRLEDEEEIHNIGVEEYFYSGSPCFIEWAEKIPNYLPEKYLEICIDIKDENTRNIALKHHG